MNIKGIRIHDEQINNVLTSSSTIFDVVKNGNNFHWSVLSLDGVLKREENAHLGQIIDTIDNSKNGLILDWTEINQLFAKLFQTYETVIIGCKNKESLHRYPTEKEMILSCDIVLILVDCTFWEIFSKDKQLIAKFSKKFKKVEPIDIENIKN